MFDQSFVEVWDDYVSRGQVDCEALLGGIGELMSETLTRDAVPEMAYMSFSLATQSFLIGTERLGHLAAVIERSFAFLYEGQLEPSEALPVLASGIETMGKAFSELLAADKSGARIESTPIDAAIYELETLHPMPRADGNTAPIRPVSKAGPDVLLGRLSQKPSMEKQQISEDQMGESSLSSPTATLEAAASGETWQPDVDEDMLDLFFQEVNERIDALSIKLLEIEKRPQDVELLRDVFRDWHTIKGSSAMVKLQPMTELSHAAEDLVGQLREGERNATAAVVDALLAALDALRTIAGQAQLGGLVSSAGSALFNRLRSPETSVPIAPPIVSQPSLSNTALAKGKATIRVDFDKLDVLMNLVGELVLGRDGLSGAISALASLRSELSGQQRLSRLLAKLAVPQPTTTPNATANHTQLLQIREELGRVERVLLDIYQELDTSSGRLDTISGDLRDSVMNLRMVPVGGILRKHHRTVRDLAKSLGKEVQLELEGEEVELDKLLVETLDEPLMHLVRNAVDHGVESRQARQEAGKSTPATIQIAAKHVGNQIVLQIRDDGQGIDVETIKAKALDNKIASSETIKSMSDKEALELIFHAGFSTSEIVSEVSGRGVGMDVVRQTIVHELKGSIDIESTLGAGSTFTLRMPLTLAITHVLLVRTGGETLAVPLDSVVRTLVVPLSAAQRIVDKEIIIDKGAQIPLIHLGWLLNLESDHSQGNQSINVVVCQHGEKLYGLVVDATLEKKEIVIKSLGEILESVPCIAGATLLGERCCVILDIPAVIERAMQQPVAADFLASGQVAQQKDPSKESKKSILLVEDSDTVRESLRRILSEAGYRVVVADDGIAGLALARQEQFDLVSTDVMMPNLDGYGLTRALRRDEKYRDTPIIMVTSRGERIDRVRGFDAGVDEYITKPHDRHLLLHAVKKLLGEA